MWRSGSQLPPDCGRLSAERAALTVKRRAKTVGREPARYAGHSLRAGLATSAAAAGGSEQVIMSQTGHRSADMVRRYTRERSLFREMPPVWRACNRLVLLVYRAHRCLQHNASSSGGLLPRARYSEVTKRFSLRRQRVGGSAPPRGFHDSSVERHQSSSHKEKIWGRSLPVVGLSQTLARMNG